MDIINQGIILNVFNFDKCVSFYKTVFNLPEMFSKVDGDFRLTCLKFGNSYLMLETGGIASESEKDFTKNPTILRFNVACIQSALEHISKFDSSAKIIEQGWGSIIRVVDPDGNPISIRDDYGFQRDLKIS
ncbi:glyoxalase/bleomycin resistance/dioxygenase family protein, partial [Photobacterium kishitanii]|uniref:glyoxalase/bleomycin resistance/dioxygenase family protein n=1 Tax=Photobacterium kishitanii TaxID=318456 RepID=UPI000D1546D7